MKTLVRAKHAAGPMENGGDGCHARSSNNGMCPGVEIAAWLNGLGEDEAPYGRRTTNGQVRQNYLRHFQHIERAK